MGLLKPGREQDAEPQVISSVMRETFVPQQVNVTANEPELGEEPTLIVDLFIGQMAPNLFMFSKAVTLTPETAIAVGEHLAEQGRKLRSGLVKGSAVDLANLKRAA